MKTVTLKPERLFRAVSDTTRLRILNLLLAGELCVCDIVAALDILQPTASRHLAYLRKTGLVTGRKEGVWAYYQLAEISTDFEACLRQCIECCVHMMPRLAKDAQRLSGRSDCCQ